MEFEFRKHKEECTMDNVVGKILMDVVEWIKRNYKKPKLWITVLVLLIVFFWIMPYVDSNLWYYDRMEKRVQILEQIASLDMSKIEANEVLKSEYQSILNEIQIQEDIRLGSIINKFANCISEIFGGVSDEGNPWIKAFTGAFWFILITILIPFMNTFKSKREKMMGFLLFAIFSLIACVVCANIPIIINPFINYIGIPLINNSDNIGYEEWRFKETALIGYVKKNCVFF